MVSPISIRPSNNARQFIVGIAAIALTLTGCSTSVKRVQSDSTIDLTGKWNDTDSRLVSEEMIKDCLAQAWLHKYKEAKTAPTVIVGEIKNKSHEHINTQTFVTDMEKALINSGQVEFVASKAQRDALRAEVADQGQNASAESAKASGEEEGADLMMVGSINTIVDQAGSEAVVFYQVDLELIELQSNKKKWIGSKKIKKFVERTKTKF